MAASSLEQRVSRLEKQMASLLSNGQNGRGRDWQSTIGVFAGDDLMKRVFEEGRKIRTADRRKTITRGVRKRRANS